MIEKLYRYILLTSLVGGHSFVLFIDLSDIYIYFILLFILYQLYWQIKIIISYWV